MKRTSLLFLLITPMIAGITMNAGAQTLTADDIISKHINAIGGKEKLAAIKVLYIESDFDIMGNTASSTAYILNGKGFRSDVDFGGQQITQCITDSGGWSINPLAGMAEATPLPEDQVKSSKAQLEVGGPLFDYASKGYTASLEGQEDVNGVKAYKVKLVIPGGPQMNFFIDPTTFYILKTVSTIAVNGQDTETTSSFSDYRKTDFGNVMPYSTEVVVPQGFTIALTTKKVEVNKDIDPSIFRMPGK